jgi:hypothetical protein
MFLSWEGGERISANQKPYSAGARITHTRWLLVYTEANAHTEHLPRWERIP